MEDSRQLLRKGAELESAVERGDATPGSTVAALTALQDRAEAERQGAIKSGDKLGEHNAWVAVGHGRALLSYWRARAAGRDATTEAAAVLQGDVLLLSYLDAIKGGDKTSAKALAKALGQAWGVTPPQ